MNKHLGQAEIKKVTQSIEKFTNARSLIYHLNAKKKSKLLFKSSKNNADVSLAEYLSEVLKDNPDITEHDITLIDGKKLKLKITKENEKVFKINIEKPVDFKHIANVNIKKPYDYSSDELLSIESKYDNTLKLEFDDKNNAFFSIDTTDSGPAYRIGGVKKKTLHDIRLLNLKKVYNAFDKVGSNPDDAQILIKNYSTTGSGKTVDIDLLLEPLLDSDIKIFYLVPNTQLIDQAYNEILDVLPDNFSKDIELIRENAPEVKDGKIAQKKFNKNSKIIIISQEALLTSYYEAFNQEKSPSFTIIDEVHIPSLDASPLLDYRLKKIFENRSAFALSATPPNSLLLMKENKNQEITFSNKERFDGGYANPIHYHFEEAEKNSDDIDDQGANVNVTCVKDFETQFLINRTKPIDPNIKNDPKRFKRELNNRVKRKIENGMPLMLSDSENFLLNFSIAEGHLDIKYNYVGSKSVLSKLINEHKKILKSAFKKIFSSGSSTKLYQTLDSKKSLAQFQKEFPDPLDYFFKYDYKNDLDNNLNQFESIDPNGIAEAKKKMFLEICDFYNIKKLKFQLSKSVSGKSIASPEFVDDSQKAAFEFVNSKFDHIDYEQSKKFNIMRGMIDNLIHIFTGFDLVEIQSMRSSNPDRLCDLFYAQFLSINANFDQGNSRIKKYCESIEISKGQFLPKEISDKLITELSYINNYFCKYCDDKEKINDIISFDSCAIEELFRKGLSYNSSYEIDNVIHIFTGLSLDEIKSLRSNEPDKLCKLIYDTLISCSKKNPNSDLKEIVKNIFVPEEIKNKLNKKNIKLLEVLSKKLEHKDQMQEFNAIIKEPSYYVKKLNAANYLVDDLTNVFLLQNKDFPNLKFDETKTIKGFSLENTNRGKKSFANDIQNASNGMGALFGSGAEYYPEYLPKEYTHDVINKLASIGLIGSIFDNSKATGYNNQLLHNIVIGIEKKHSQLNNPDVLYQACGRVSRALINENTPYANVYYSKGIKTILSKEDLKQGNFSSTLIEKRAESNRERNKFYVEKIIIEMKREIKSRIDFTNSCNTDIMIENLNNKKLYFVKIFQELYVVNDHDIELTKKNFALIIKDVSKSFKSSIIKRFLKSLPSFVELFLITMNYIISFIEFIVKCVKFLVNKLQFLLMRKIMINNVAKRILEIENTLKDKSSLSQDKINELELECKNLKELRDENLPKLKPDYEDPKDIKLLKVILAADNIESKFSESEVNMISYIISGNDLITKLGNTLKAEPDKILKFVYQDLSKIGINIDKDKVGDFFENADLDKLTDLKNTNTLNDQLNEINNFKEDSEKIFNNVKKELLGKWTSGSAQIGSFIALSILFYAPITTIASPFLLWGATKLPERPKNILKACLNFGGRQITRVFNSLSSDNQERIKTLSQIALVGSISGLTQLPLISNLLGIHNALNTNSSPAVVRLYKALQDEGFTQNNSSYTIEQKVKLITDAKDFLNFKDIFNNITYGIGESVKSFEQTKNEFEIIIAFTNFEVFLKQTSPSNAEEVRRKKDDLLKSVEAFTKSNPSVNASGIGIVDKLIQISRKLNEFHYDGLNFTSDDMQLDAKNRLLKSLNLSTLLNDGLYSTALNGGLYDRIKPVLILYANIDEKLKTTESLGLENFNEIRDKFIQAIDLCIETTKSDYKNSKLPNALNNGSEEEVEKLNMFREYLNHFNPSDDLVSNKDNVKKMLDGIKPNIMELIGRNSQTISNETIKFYKDTCAEIDALSYDDIEQFKDNILSESNLRIYLKSFDYLYTKNFTNEYTTFISDLKNISSKEASKEEASNLVNGFIEKLGDYWLKIELQACSDHEKPAKDKKIDIFKNATKYLQSLKFTDGKDENDVIIKNTIEYIEKEDSLLKLLKEENIDYKKNIVQLAGNLVLDNKNTKVIGSLIIKIFNLFVTILGIKSKGLIVVNEILQIIKALDSEFLEKFLKEKLLNDQLIDSILKFATSRDTKDIDMKNVIMPFIRSFFNELSNIDQKRAKDVSIALLKILATNIGMDLKLLSVLEDIIQKIPVDKFKDAVNYMLDDIDKALEDENSIEKTLKAIMTNVVYHISNGLIRESSTFAFALEVGSQNFTSILKSAIFTDQINIIKQIGFDNILELMNSKENANDNLNKEKIEKLKIFIKDLQSMNIEDFVRKYTADFTKEDVMQAINSIEFSLEDLKDHKKLIESVGNVMTSSSIELFDNFVFVYQILNEISNIQRNPTKSDLYKNSSNKDDVLWCCGMNENHQKPPEPNIGSLIKLTSTMYLEDVKNKRRLNTMVDKTLDQLKEEFIDPIIKGTKGKNLNKSSSKNAQESNKIGHFLKDLQNPNQEQFEDPTFLYENFEKQFSRRPKEAAIAA